MGEKRMYTCMYNWVTMLYSRKKNCPGNNNKKIKIQLKKLPHHQHVLKKCEFDISESSSDRHKATDYLGMGWCLSVLCYL